MAETSEGSPVPAHAAGSPHARLAAALADRHRTVYELGKGGAAMRRAVDAANR